MAPQSDVGPALPIRAELQPVFHRGGAEVRRRARHMPRHLAHLPLQPLASRRL